MIAVMSELMEELEPMLCSEVSVPAGGSLFHVGDKVERLFAVRSGCVHLVRFGEDGRAAVMQRATAGTLLAESSVFSAVYHCDAVAVEATSLACADIGAVRARLATNPALTAALARHLAGEVHRMRVRVEVLSQRTVRDRLAAWLALVPGGLPAPGRLRAVAEDLGVSPEALYRELARRRAAAPEP